MIGRLRPATLDDAGALALVGQATFLETFSGVLDGRDIVAHCRAEHSAERYAEWLARSSAAASLAEVDPGGAPVGYFLLDEARLPVSDPQPTDVELKRIYVLGRYQGTGIGAALMRQALATSRARGRARVLLGVHAGNARALAFYARQGFRRVAERRFTVGHHAYDDLVLALDL